MAIVTTEISSVHGDADKQRLAYYRCKDSQGVWHSYGPVIINDAAFDIQGYKTVVAAKMEDQLAEQEANALIGE